MLIKMLSQQYKKQHQSLVFIYLELQLLEEPSVLAALVSLLELGADHVSGFLLLHGILQYTEGLVKCLERDKLSSVHEQNLCLNTSGIVYLPAMEDWREEQLVLMAECCLSCIARVSPTPVTATQR